jgi:hypothetical protein
MYETGQSHLLQPTTVPLSIGHYNFPVARSGGGTKTAGLDK